MSTAVHGKASLADVLPADCASAGKSADDDRDKTNTLDFGATLTSLIDQTAVDKDSIGRDLATSSPAPIRGKHSADALRTFGSGAADAPATVDSNTKDAPMAFDSTAADTTTAFEPGAEDAPMAFDTSTTKVDSRFSKVATTPRPGSESRTDAPTREVSAHASSARTDSFAALLDDRTSAIRPGDVAADEPSLHQIDTSTSDDAVSTSKTSEGGAIATPTSDVVKASDRTGQSADTAMVARSGVAAMVDSPVRDTNIALDRKTQASSPKATDDSGPAPSAQVTASASNPATVANPAQIDADAKIQIAPTPRAADSAHSHISRANDGTSLALSTQSADSDSMNPADPKITQPTFANLTAEATASSMQPSPQKQMDAAAQVAPQEQPGRSANRKETSTQATDPSSLPNDSAHSVDAQPTARSPEAAAIRLTPEVASAREPSHTVSITVQLASGQTAQASVRERAGAVDVKILTPTAASAQRVSSEMDGMRQNLDAAGIKLGHSEISYRQGDGGRQGHEGYRPPAQNQSANGKEVFIMNEVIQ